MQVVQLNMIHQTAIISTKAKIGHNVIIEPYCIIHDNVEIGDNCFIGSFSEIGLPTPLAQINKLVIGGNSTIRSHSVLYIGSMIGEYFSTGHYASVRENSEIGKNVQLGSRSDIQGDCSIGDYTKMHADVHVGKCSKIGSYVWLFPEVLLTNDPTPPSENLKGVTIEDFAVLAAKVLVLPGVTIHKDAVIAASSVVKTDVPTGKMFSGNPGKVVCSANILRCANNPKIRAYPWRNRFHRGYSEEDVQQWLNNIK